MLHITSLGHVLMAENPEQASPIALLKPLLVSYLQISDWLKQVTGTIPESKWEGTKRNGLSVISLD